jgi:hypothetical protein
MDERYYISSLAWQRGEVLPSGAPAAMLADVVDLKEFTASDMLHQRSSAKSDVPCNIARPKNVCAAEAQRAVKVRPQAQQGSARSVAAALRVNFRWS